MEIKGKIEVQGYTRISDLDDGETFTFCDDDDLYMKGVSRNGCTYAINLADGMVYDIDEECWWDNRPVRLIKSILEIQ